MTQEETKGIITVNVPGVSARYRFLLSAFVTVEKSVFNRMMEAVSKDTETAEENLRKILETLRENESKWKYGRGAFDRVKVAKSFFQEKETPKQKRFNKAVQAFCVDKKNPREALRLPFMRPDGKLYATDSYTAVRIDNPSIYTGDVSEGSGCSMEKLFPADFETWQQYVLPDEKTLKDWIKTGKIHGNEPIFTTRELWEKKICVSVPKLLKAVTLTGSSRVYVSDRFSVITGEGITCLILNMAYCNFHIEPFEKACIFVKDDATLNDMLCDISYLQPEEVKPEVKPAEEVKPEDMKPAEEPEEPENVKPEEKPAADPVSIGDFSRMVSKEYNRLYESRDSIITREESWEYQNRFDGNMTDYEKRVLSALVDFRKDYISSDREVNAFYMALDSLAEKGIEISLPAEPEAEPEEIPETEPETPETMEEPETAEDPVPVETMEEPEPIETAEAADPFTIKYNSQFGSTDISFKEKPSAEVIQALKKMRFKWHKMKRLWYGYKDPDTVRSAVLSAGKQEDIKPAEVKPAEKKPVSIPDKYKTYYETIFNALRECHENPKDPGRVAYYNGLLSAGSMFLPPETLSSFPRFS